MKIKSIKIHNFRSIKDAEFELNDYNVFVGANNSGKSNVITALRIFYEDNIKFNEKLDFPKFETEDKESWIEIKYLLTDDEFKNLKETYKNPGNVLIVRKYLKSEEPQRVKANQSNIYAYENGTLSTKLFYGAKNISQAKLGSVIYIPEITKTEETLKLTGPSPLRNTLAFVMKKVMKTSESFKSLNDAFEEFNRKFKEEASKDGVSLEKFRKEINENLKEWGVEFNLDINPVRPEDIIKNLISHSFTDKTLNREMNIGLYGQGLQRHLIYILIRLSAQYKEEKVYEKKEFSPELTLILFEEPEVFLHPAQQEYLNSSLRFLASEVGQQVIVSTHSPVFVSRNIEEISSLIKLKRENGVTKCFQVSDEIKNNILKENNELAQILREKLEDPTVDNPTKNRIKKILGETDDEIRMEEEAIRYSLWLDSERCSSFFADIVLICEGATEKTLIDYLIQNEWDDLKEKRIYVLDAMGKFNIHRYINLFGKLGIYHSIIADRDEDNNVHEIINKFIENRKNSFTKKIHFFEKDIEEFLGIPSPPDNRIDKKPLNVIWHYKNGKISQEKKIN
ncbi:ATP-dependent nuclease [Thermodesulfatator atlanticus]|uniref:ATP-dependent nuclease n=1 Tax=Thermodesulfatator atlanticus TaxID=501497 RepID=UPI0003B44591|nr:AAA family ATPase [Thermodesulfatator atlanticus]